MLTFRPGTRRWWLLAVTVLVAAVHAWLTWSVSALITDLHASENSSIQKMEATYVTELKLSEPPVAAPAPPKVKRPARPVQRQAKPPSPKASEPDPPEPQPLPPVMTETVSEPDEAAAVAQGPEAVIEGASAPVAAASEPGPPFVWPLATRVSYKVQGYFRGPIQGKARVEWVRQDQNYQVHVETSLGLIGSLSMISAGTITQQGLAPSRFEQVNRLLIKTSPPRTVVFEDKEVVLDSGERFERTVGMQDGASQFIQLSYQFIMKPELLRPGNVVYLDLAFPKKVERIAYDVTREEILKTPLGDVPTFHVKPRKMSTEGGVLPVEIWFAPGLQYLPVRVLVQVDDKTHMDWQMDRAPEQTPLDPESATPALN
ncbi:MAG: DUF3108 domain-containing protein [Rubrivivax sp.]|nr:MAG: DUF3108 domain-containing protein [Rubrivivax sp.]